MRHRLTLALAVALSAPFTALADDEAQLYVPIPAGWVVAYEGNTATAKTIELIPEGETIDTWMNLIAIYVVDRAAAGNAADFFSYTTGNMLITCRGPGYQILSEVVETEPGVKAPDPAAPSALFLTVCPWSNVQFTENQDPAPYGEIGAYFVIPGQQRLFAIKRAWRTTQFEGQELPIADVDLQLEVLRISNAALCDIGASEDCATRAAEWLSHFTDAGDTIFQTDGAIAP